MNAWRVQPSSMTQAHYIRLDYATLQMRHPFYEFQAIGYSYNGLPYQ